jgi:hypothetical protein
MNMFLYTTSKISGENISLLLKISTTFLNPYFLPLKKLYKREAPASL